MSHHVMLPPLVGFHTIPISNKAGVFQFPSLAIRRYPMTDPMGLVYVYFTLHEWLTGWWFFPTPLKNMRTSNWIISPQIGVKIPKMLIFMVFSWLGKYTVRPMDPTGMEKHERNKTNSKSPNPSWVISSCSRVAYLSYLHHVINTCDKSIVVKWFKYILESACWFLNDPKESNIHAMIIHCPWNYQWVEKSCRVKLSKPELKRFKHLPRSIFGVFLTCLSRGEFEGNSWN